MKNYEFFLDLAFLADTTNLLNNFNLKLQGYEKNLLDMSKILFNFKTELFLLLAQMKSEDYSNFPKTSLIYVKQNHTKQHDHVSLFETLFYNFQDRFKDFENVEPLLELFGNPFNCDISNYEFKIQSEVIILRSELKAPDKIRTDEFWKNLDGSIIPELKKKLFEVFIIFPFDLHLRKKFFRF